MAYMTLIRTDHPTYVDRFVQRGLTSLVDVVKEARPAVQLVFGLRAAAAAGVLRQPTAHRFVGIFGWLLLTVAAYAFNGVADVTEDTANGSSRPIASGRLSVVVACRWCAVLIAIGLALCAFASLAELVVAVAALLLGWAYSAGPSLKNSPVSAAAVIGITAALTYLAGSAAAGVVTMKALAVPMSIALWVALCCVAKDFSDVDGDRVAGRRTWPVVLGHLGAAKLLAGLSVGGASLGLLLALATRSDVVAAIGLAAGSLVLAITVLATATDRERRVRRRSYRVFLSTQYIANAMLLVTVP